MAHLCTGHSFSVATCDVTPQQNDCCTCVWSQALVCDTCMLCETALTRSSILIPVAFRLRFLKLQLCESQTGQTETVGILTIISLHLAIMAATFVCMKQFLSALDSGLIGDHESPGVTLDTFRSPRSAGASKMMKSVDTNESNIVMRPDRARNVTRVQARASVLGDDDGMESDGSDRAIITRTKEWEVSYQNASSAPLTPL